MWDPQRLTTLRAFTACYRDSFTFYSRYILRWKWTSKKIHLNDANESVRWSRIEKAKFYVKKRTSIVCIFQYNSIFTVNLKTICSSSMKASVRISFSQYIGLYTYKLRNNKPGLYFKVDLETYLIKYLPGRQLFRKKVVEGSERYLTISTLFGKL
jgi:hypothetical protein